MVKIPELLLLSPWKIYKDLTWWECCENMHVCPMEKYVILPNQYLRGKRHGPLRHRRTEKVQPGYTMNKIKI
jgi:hypothetical protein